MFTTTSIMADSIAKANDIFNRSENLRVVGAKADIYKDRIPYLTDLLGVDGHISFNPFVSKDLAHDFQEVLKEDRQAKDRYYYRTSYTKWEEEKKARDEHILADVLFKHVDSTDLINNRVPAEVESVIDNYEIKGYSSPRLSKMLVKLFGEQSDVVKWFTNDCPKNLDKGLNMDYKVHLSILPHHIAGMAYYAPFNWGGEKWITGWSNTSCMDTIRNSTGGGVYQLPPNLRDETLAIAYLTQADNDDLFAPRYLARVLVRVTKVNDNDFVMVALRPFFTSTETKHILIEGLKSEFENFIHVDDLRRDYKHSELKTFRMDTDVAWITSSKESCDDCDGDGFDDDGDTCGNCDGKGYRMDDYSRHLPYIDDPDFISWGDDGAVEFTLPINWLVEKGYIEKPKEEVLPRQLYYAC